MLPFKVQKQYAVSRFLRRHREFDAQTHAIHFANINSSKSVWWYDIPMRIVNSINIKCIDILAYDYRTGELNHLMVPAEYIISNLAGLVIRKKKDTISLELSADSEDMFVDVRPGGIGIKFSQFETFHFEEGESAINLARVLRERRIRAATTQPGGSSLHDPVEDETNLRAVFEEVAIETERSLQEAGIANEFGYCHRVWDKQAQILRSRFGIIWFSPSQMNPLAHYV